MDFRSAGVGGDFLAFVRAFTTNFSRKSSSIKKKKKPATIVAGFSAKCDRLITFWGSHELLRAGDRSGLLARCTWRHY